MTKTKLQSPGPKRTQARSFAVPATGWAGSRHHRKQGIHVPPAPGFPVKALEMPVLLGLLLRAIHSGGCHHPTFNGWQKHLNLLGSSSLQTSPGYGAEPSASKKSGCRGCCMRELRIGSWAESMAWF